MYAWMFVTIPLYFLILLLPLPSWLKYVGPLTLGFVLFVLAFSLRFGLGDAVADPKTVLNGLAHRLRSARYRVEETDGELTTQVDSISAIKIRARACESGTKLTYRMEGTPLGWTLTLILIFSGYFIILIPPVVLFMLRRVRRFAREQVGPLIMTHGLPEVDPVSIKIHKALIDSLSEGYRLSSEAYEAAKSNHEDNIIILFVLGFIVLVVTDFVLVEINPGVSSRSLPTLFMISIAIASAFMLLLVWSLRRRAKPRLNELKGWATRLEGALMKETSLAKPGDEEQSVFELLSDAWNQVPKWMEIRRKSGLYREPGTWILIMGFAGLSFSVLVFALLMFVQNPLPSVVAGALSAGALYVVHILYSRSIKRLDEERTRVISDWNRRLGVMNSQMDKHLQEL